LPELYQSLPRSVGVLSIAMVAHFPLDLKDNRNSLLDGHLPNVRSDRQPEFEAHAVWFCPDPGSVHHVNFVVGLVGMPLFVEYRNVLEAYRQELGGFGFAVLVMIRIGSRIETPTLPALMHDNRIPNLVSLDHALEVKILSKTRRALIGAVGENHGPAQTTGNLVDKISA